MREAKVERSTRETRLKLTLNLDGRGESEVSTGVKFLDHLLGSFSRHSLIDLEIEAEGDLQVDDHHTVEDVAIILGQALNKAIGDKGGLNRFGSAIIPMDDALIIAAVDLSGRAYYQSSLSLKKFKIGDMSGEMVDHFLQSLATTTGMNLHIMRLRGRNDHHKAEAAFKALGRALAQAVTVNPRLGGRVPSEKGVL